MERITQPDLNSAERLSEFRTKFLKILEQNDLVLLGESHSEKRNYELYQIAMESVGMIDGIFIEKGNDEQGDIDYYMQTGELNESFKSEIEGITGYDKDIEKKERLILDSARIAGVPIICVDSSRTINEYYNKKSVYGSYFLAGKDRDEDMYNNVRRYMSSHPGKYLMISGANHVSLARFINKTQVDKTLGFLLKNDCQIKVGTMLLLYGSYVEKLSDEDRRDIDACFDTFI